MKFGLLLIRSAIPEWRVCYISYDLFKKLLKVILMANDAIQRLTDGQGTNMTDADENNEKQQRLMNIATEANTMFFQQHLEEMEVTFMFFQLKLIELQDKLHQLQKLDDMPRGDERLLYIVQRIYVQVSYVNSLYQINLEGERKILKKHKKVVKSLNLPVPYSHAHKINRLAPTAKDLVNQLQEFYVVKSAQPVKEARIRIRGLVNKKDYDEVGSFLFGVGIGIGVSIIGLIIALTALSPKVISTDPTFSRDFPVWRGIGFFVIYMWILAINVYLFQTKHINHRLIFKFVDSHASTSVQAFYRASIFSAVYLILFLLYIIQYLNNMEFIYGMRTYLGGIVWIMFIVYIFLPVPIFNWKGRLYMGKTILKSIVAPVTGVDFPVIWTTDQFISLVNPLRDMAYTACYYTQLDLKNSTSSAKCSNSVEVLFVAGCIALIMRVLQCIKVGYDNKHYFFAPSFYNTLKYLSSLLTLLFSFLYTSADKNIFWAWVVFAMISTCFSFYWDIYFDWGLLQKSKRNPYLRDDLCYGGRGLYYFIMIINFVLRLSWVFSLSPNIVASFHILPVLFSLITGSVEIIRRGVWNLLRVEKEHLANCEQFKAVSGVDPRELSSQPNNHDNSLEVLFENRRQKLLESLRHSVQEKKDMTYELQNFIDEKSKEIKRIVKQM